MSEHRAGRGWLLYDGGCGMCARWVPYWAPTLARLGLEIAPLQAPWVRDRLPLAPDALLSDVRLLLDDGTHLAGADVYRYVMRRLRWAYPGYLVAAAPGLRQIFDASYPRSPITATHCPPPAVWTLPPSRRRGVRSSPQNGGTS